MHYGNIGPVKADSGPFTEITTSGSIIGRMFDLEAAQEQLRGELENALASHSRELEDHLNKIKSLANIIGAQL